MPLTLRLLAVSLVASVLGCAPNDPAPTPQPEAVQLSAAPAPAPAKVPSTGTGVPRPQGTVAETISPPSATVSPGGTATFSITQNGGMPPYTVHLTAGSGTGASATLDAMTGTQITYNAGSTGSTTDTLYVIDSNMNQSNTVTITLPKALSATPGTATLLSNGTQQFTAMDGTPPYTWKIVNPAKGSLDTTSGSQVTYTASAATDYTDQILLTDSTGGTTFVPVNVGHAVSITNGDQTVATRDSFSFSATGGTSNGTYTWKVLSSSPAGPYGTIDSTGKYTAGTVASTSATTLTDKIQVSDGNGHTATAVVTIGQVLMITGAPSGTVPGGTTVTTLGITGGTAVVKSWAITTKNTGTTATIDAATGVYTAGHIPNQTDTITVTDSKNNTATATISTGAGITVTAVPSSTPLASPPLGTIHFTAAGGSNAGFVWTPTTLNSGGNIVSNMDGSGDYTAGSTGSVVDTVTVTDGNGNHVAVTINVSAGVTFSASTSSIAPLGTFTFQATGGKGPYQYTEDAKSGGSIGLNSGAYVAGSTGMKTDTITATDSLGNTKTTTISVGNGVVISPGSETVYPKSTTAISASGGAGTYTYALEASPNGALVTTVTTACPTPPCYVAGAGSTANTLMDTLTVTDKNSNTSSVVFTIGKAITIASSPVLATVAPSGTLTLTATGGNNGPYTWSFKTSSNKSGGTLAAGMSGETYQAGSTGGVTDTVQVTDALGNTAQFDITVTAALSLSVNKTSVAPQGKATFTASGGNATTYTYSVTTAGSSGTIRSASVGATTGAYQAGDKGGSMVTDTITVTDANGVTATKSISVTVGVSLSPTLAATAPGGTAAFTASGGDTVDGYTWSVSIDNSMGATVDQTGHYTAGSTTGTTDTVQAKDANGNVATVQVSVGGIAIGPSMPTAAPHGSISFLALGGTGTGFKWKLSSAPSGGSINSNTGVYVAGGTGSVSDTVVVTDSGGNHSQILVVVGAAISITPSMANLNAGDTQSFSVTGGSGTGYSWSLSTNSSGGMITTDGAYTAGTTAGTDVVQVVDSLGSAAAATVTVTVPVVTNPDMGAVDMAMSDVDMAHVEVDAAMEGDAAVTTKKSGGGCDLGGAGAASPLALLLGAAMIVLLRRRRIAVPVVAPAKK